jgi:NAD-dependent DNA ligase
MGCSKVISTFFTLFIMKLLAIMHNMGTSYNRNHIDVLVVGDRATIVSLKIKNAIKLGIPIVKESDLLEDIGFYR